jgi:molybdopterin-guanine dinucleotide biosynthesis protein A
VLRETFNPVVAVGKAADALPLPFPVVDDESDERAAIVGLRAALRGVETPVAVVLPTDMPLVTPTMLRVLARALEASDADAATFAQSPLPAALRVSALPVVERRVEQSEFELRASLDDR